MNGKKVIGLSIVALLFGGCVDTLMQSTTSSSGLIDKVSTLKEQAFGKVKLEKVMQDVIVASSLVKTNYTILHEMPMFTEAKWVADLVKSYDETYEKSLNKKLANDYYYATQKYTYDGSFAKNNIVDHLSFSDKTLFYRLDVLYSTKPDIYDFSSNEFSGGVLNSVESSSSQKYPNVEEAIFSFFKGSLKSDIINAKKEWMRYTRKIASLQGQIKDNERKIAESEDEATKSKIQDEIKVLQARVLKESLVKNEKEKTFDEIWERAILTIPATISPSQAKLASSINSVLNIVIKGSAKASGALTLDLADTYSYAKGFLKYFTNEVAYLTNAKAKAKADKKEALIDKRIEKLQENKNKILPALGSTAVLLKDQLLLVKKYKDAIGKILDKIEKK